MPGIYATRRRRAAKLFTFPSRARVVLFWEALSTTAHRAWSRYVAAAVLAASSHFFAVLAVLTHAAWARVVRLPPGPRAEFRRSLKLIGLLLLPLFVFIASRGMGPIAWIPRPSWRDLHAFALFLTGNGSDWLLLLYAAVIGVLLGAARRSSRRPAIVFLLLWLLLPLAITLAFSLLRSAFLPRYLLICVVPLLLMAAMGIVHIKPQWLAAALLALMLALSVRGTLAYYRADFDLGREDWRACTRYVADHARPGDGVLFHSAQARMPFEYYAGSWPGRRTLRVIFPADNPDGGPALTYRDFLANTKNLVLASVPAHYRRVWVVFAHNRLTGGQPDATTRSLEQFLQQRSGPPALSRFQGIDLLVYGSDTPAQ